MAIFIIIAIIRDANMLNPIALSPLKTTFNTLLVLLLQSLATQNDDNHQRKSPKGKRRHYHLGRRRRHAAEELSFHSDYAPPSLSGGWCPAPPTPSPNLIIS